MYEVLHTPRYWPTPHPPLSEKNTEIFSPPSSLSRIFFCTLTNKKNNTFLTKKLKFKNNLSMGRVWDLKKKKMNNWTEMHSIQEKPQVFCQICIFIQTYSEKSNYVNTPLTPLSEINQKLANPLFPPCQKNHKLDNSPSDDHNNLNIGILE